MSKVKLNLRYMTVIEKAQFARQIVTAMTGNATFSNPEPPLSDVTDAATNLETAINAANVARQNAMEKTSLMDDANVALDNILTKLGNYVDSTSNGDEAKILSTGMSVKAKPVPVGALPQPTALAATAGDNEGEADLSFNPVHGAGSYAGRYCEDPITPEGWKSAGISTKSSMTVKGLTSGRKYWFQVAAVGAAGQGPWSDPATTYAP
jgi:hypothetical protein